MTILNVSSLAKALPVVPVAASTTRESTGVGRAFSGFFETVLSEAGNFVGDVAAVGRTRLVNDIFGPTISPSEFGGGAASEAPAEVTTPEDANGGFFGGVSESNFLIAGGAVVGLLALVLILRS